MLGLQVTTPDFPGIGNNVPVGILFLFHIAVAEFSLGAITLAIVAEWHHVRTGDPRTARYARSLANSYYLVFSLGATFAVFAVVLLTGLWANEFGQLVNKFLWLVAVAFGLFFLITPLLVWYRYSFASMAPRRHATLGSVLAVLQTLFMVLIVGMDSYLINPVHAGLTEPVLNPVYWPLLLHRLGGNVSWTALLCAGYAALRLRRSRDNPEERSFQSWAARVNLRVGLILALVMPIDGFLLVELIKQNQPGYFDNLVAGVTASFMVAQECLVGAIFIGGNIALASEDGGPREWSMSSRLAIAVSLAGMTLAALPSAILGATLNPVRYVGLAGAMLATAANLGVRMRGRRQRQDDSLRVTGSASRIGRGALVTVGTVSIATTLLMGYIKEHARGDYAIYGELRQVDAHQQYNPPPGLYP
ncbi:MAG: cytochrome ubiquinol oxidase subunit I [Candidatus Dormibacteraeota bacterium]|uniref:Cytochrome ubiquinol oxidase subunit I n=1 Tax=Candidatus Amunia macphersoniae TaxID=3127014 RepID=A0A934KQJ5_9BACT|nr:cytochrome ubiquinol oxidase subunit I [Candidatus Dormibacteraeota bacterium]